jgi:hypothetical protein
MLVKMENEYSYFYNHKLFTNPLKDVVTGLPYHILNLEVVHNPTGKSVGGCEMEFHPYTKMLVPLHHWVDSNGHLGKNVEIGMARYAAGMTGASQPMLRASKPPVISKQTGVSQGTPLTQPLQNTVTPVSKSITELKPASFSPETQKWDYSSFLSKEEVEGGYQILADSENVTIMLQNEVIATVKIDKSSEKVAKIDDSTLNKTELDQSFEIPLFDAFVAHCYHIQKKKVVLI